MRLLLSILLITMANLAFAQNVEVLKLRTPRGVEIDAVIHYPTSASPFPVVIIGPGEGYHMGLPLTEGLAQKLAAQGYAAIRFNWHYYGQDGEPSNDLLNEVEDFSTVVGFAKTNLKIDKNKIIVAGKSLGTVVSYKYFISDPQVKALVLLTPICSWPWDDNGNDLSNAIPVGPAYYPELLKSTRPVVMTLGNNDPLCSIPMLYDFLKSSSGNIATVVVEGDHGLNVGPRNDPEFELRNAKNIEAATDMIIHWIGLIVDRL